MQDANRPPSSSFNQLRSDFAENLKVIRQTTKDLHEQVRRTKEQIAKARQLFDSAFRMPKP